MRMSFIRPSGRVVVAVLFGVGIAGSVAAPAMAGPTAATPAAETAELVNGGANEVREEMYPGDRHSTFLSVANLGPSPADGAVAVFTTEDEVEFDDTFRNCLYNAHKVVCRFEQELTPQTRYAFTLEQLYRLRGDAEPGETVATIRWHTLAELPADDPSLAGLDPGSKPAVELRATPGEPWGTPPSDTAHITITVKEPKVDLAAIGDTIKGAVGDVVELKVGIENVGTQTKPGYDDTPTVNISVNPPEGTTIIDADPECARPNDEGRIYACDFYGPFAPGESKYVTLKVRIDKKVDGAVGSATIPEASNSPDADRTNDTAAIKVRISAGSGAGGGGGGGGELANTGAPTGLLAGLGGSTLLLGLSIAWLARRRADVA